LLAHIPFSLFLSSFHLSIAIYNNIGRLQDVKHTTRYGPLYAHYKPDRYYWSFVTIIRRVVLITLVAQLGYDRPLMFSWVTFTNILMLLVHMLARLVAFVVPMFLSFTTHLLITVLCYAMQWCASHRSIDHLQVYQVITSKQVY
jgi:hypothetical protein